jgi:hypothetical protein
MIKKWNTFNEAELKLGKVGTRPVESSKVVRDPSEFLTKKEEEVDLVDLKQQISDRMYGPDSKEYIESLIELNSKFSPRPGRTGVEFFDPSISDKRKEEQEKLIRKFK